MGDNASQWSIAYTNEGAPYYVNYATNESSWDPPPGWAEESAVSALAPAEIPVVEESQFANASEGVQNDVSTTEETSRVVTGWEKCYDGDNPYYFNHELGISQWEMPEGWIDAALDDANAVVATTANEDAQYINDTSTNNQDANTSAIVSSSSEDQSAAEEIERLPSVGPHIKLDIPVVEDQTVGSNEDFALTRTPSSTSAVEDAGEPISPQSSSVQNRTINDMEECQREESLGARVDQQAQEVLHDNNKKENDIHQVSSDERHIDPHSQAMYADYLSRKTDNTDVIPIPEYIPNDEINVGLKGLHVNMDLKELWTKFQGTLQGEFIERRFNYNRKTDIFTNVESTTEQLSCYKPQGIKSALLLVKGDKETVKKHDEDALSAMEMINFYIHQQKKVYSNQGRTHEYSSIHAELYGKKTEDRFLNKKPMFVAAELMVLFQRGGRNLRDEIYCQLIKQTTNNSDENICLHGWQLLLMCIVIASPSEALQPYLMGHCARNVKVYDCLTPTYNTIVFISIYCFLLLLLENLKFGTYESLQAPTMYKQHAIKAIYQCIRSFKLEPKIESLNFVDLEITMNLLDATTRVYFADGKYIMMPIDSLTTIEELQEAIAQKLGIKDPSPFAIIETGYYVLMF